MAGGDHFSAHAAEYAQHRPTYPAALFDWLTLQSPGLDLAWDCGCGNGQATVPLADRFVRVVATDISAQQIAHCPIHPRIEFRNAPAEDSGLANDCCDLIVVAQALHWFDFFRFYEEVARVLKPGGLLAAWTYQLLRAEPAIDVVLEDFYRRVLGPHWPPERRWVDQGYRGMPFPFADLPVPDFEITLAWTLDDLLHYLDTWTAVRRCKEADKHDPLVPLDEALAAVWGPRQTRRGIRWPIAIRAGRRALG